MARGPGQNYTPWNNVAGAQGDVSGIATAGNLFGQAMQGLQGMVDRKVDRETSNLQLLMSQAGSREELNAIMGENAGNVWANMGAVAKTGEARGNRLWDEEMQENKFAFDVDSEMHRRRMQEQQMRIAAANAAASQRNANARSDAAQRRHDEKMAWEREKYYTGLFGKGDGGNGGGGGGNGKIEDLSKVDMFNTPYRDTMNAADGAIQSYFGNSADTDEVGALNVLNPPAAFKGAFNDRGVVNRQAVDSIFDNHIASTLFESELAKGNIRQNSDGSYVHADPEAYKRMNTQARNALHERVSTTANTFKTTNSYNVTKDKNADRVATKLFELGTKQEDPKVIGGSGGWLSPAKRDTNVMAKDVRKIGKDMQTLFGEAGVAKAFQGIEYDMTNGVSYTNSASDRLTRQLVSHYPGLQDSSNVDDAYLRRHVNDYLENPHNSKAFLKLYNFLEGYK